MRYARIRAARHSADSKDRPTRWTVVAEQIPRVRDAALLLSGFVFAAGYAARAFHSWERELGVLPGAQFDYFVAGIMVLAPPTALVLAVWALWRLLKRLAGWAKSSPERTARMERVRGAVLLATAACVISAGLLKDRFPALEDPAMFGFVLGIFLIVLYSAAEGNDSSAASQAKARSRGLLSKVFGGVAYLFGVLFALNLGLLALSIFVLAVLMGPVTLARWPQELGGVSPKCAHLDLVHARLSPPVRGRLIDEKADLRSEVVRSRPLELYSLNEPWIVKLPGTPPSVTHRLDRDTVRSIVWCDR
jgi:hypothetical protein